MDNANSAEYLEKIKMQVIENLKRTAFAPSVQMTDVPRDPEGLDDEADAMLDDEDEDEHKDQRWTKRRWDKYVEKEGELSESEDEEENERNGVRRQPGTRKRRNMMDYQNLGGGLNNEDDDTGSGAISEKRGRSRERNGDAPRSAPNGSARSSASNGNGSSLSNEASDNDDDEDEDVDMADNNNTNNNNTTSATTTTQTNGTTTRPQEATPPDSPSSAAVAPISSAAEAVNETGINNEAMDEGGDLAKEEGRDERELEDVAAEHSTETVERREGSS